MYHQISEPTEPCFPKLRIGPYSGARLRQSNKTGGIINLRPLPKKLLIRYFARPSPELRPGHLPAWTDRYHRPEPYPGDHRLYHLPGHTDASRSEEHTV